MTPFTHRYAGAPPSETEGAQCQRIRAHQQEQRSKSILKHGWLWREGLVWGWDKRYFILESGNQVRSALLRIFSEDPKGMAGGRDLELYSNAIVLWDAVGISQMGGDYYGFKG